MCSERDRGWPPAFFVGKKMQEATVVFLKDSSKHPLRVFISAHFVATSTVKIADGASHHIKSASIYEHKVYIGIWHLFQVCNSLGSHGSNRVVVESPVIKTTYHLMCSSVQSRNRNRHFLCVFGSHWFSVDKQFRPLANESVPSLRPLSYENKAYLAFSTDDLRTNINNLFLGLFMQTHL